MGWLCADSAIGASFDRTLWITLGAHLQIWAPVLRLLNHFS
jgi:hypothetical protein